MELEAVAEGYRYHASNPLAIGEGEQSERNDGVNGSTRPLPPSRPPAPKRPPAFSKPHLQPSFASEAPTQVCSIVDCGSVIVQIMYTAHSISFSC